VALDSNSSDHQPAAPSCGRAPRSQDPYRPGSPSAEAAPPTRYSRLATGSPASRCPDPEAPDLQMPSKKEICAYLSAVTSRSVPQTGPQILMLLSARVVQHWPDLGVMR
jgi:hypothetical protein